MVVRITSGSSLRLPSCVSRACSERQEHRDTDWEAAMLLYASWPVSERPDQLSSSCPSRPLRPWNSGPNFRHFRLDFHRTPTMIPGASPRRTRSAVLRQLNIEYGHDCRRVSSPPAQWPAGGKLRVDGAAGSMGTQVVELLLRSWK